MARSSWGILNSLCPGSRVCAIPIAEVFPLSASLCHMPCQMRQQVEHVTLRDSDKHGNGRNTPVWDTSMCINICTYREILHSFPLSFPPEILTDMTMGEYTSEGHHHSHVQHSYMEGNTNPPRAASWGRQRKSLSLLTY